MISSKSMQETPIARAKIVEEMQEIVSRAGNLVRMKMSVNPLIIPDIRTNIIQGSTRGTTTEGEAGPPAMTEEETMARGKSPQSMIYEILRYVPLIMEGALVVRIGKSNKYAIKKPRTPKGVHVMMNISSWL